jgi:transcriptional regulator with XRE-family HTH domain
MTDNDDIQPAKAARKPVPEDALGERIREAREGRGWTQQILSNRTKIADPNDEGISRTVLVGYEAGKTKPGAREIRILAEALNVTPNWLLLGNMTPTKAEMPSLAFLEGGNELEKALRIGLAMLLLKQHERNLLGMMLFSLAGRELGDAELGGLMATGNMIAREFLEHMKADFPEIAAGCDTPQALSQLVRHIGGGSEANYGNKLRSSDEQTWEGEWLYHPPPGKTP